MFLILSLLLSGLAAAFVVVPVLRHRHTGEQVGIVERNAANLTIFKERLHELDHEYAEGRLEAAQYQSLRAELERTVLSDVEETHTQELPVQTVGTAFWRSPTRLIPVLALLLILPLSYLLYEMWGFSDDLEVAQIFERSLSDDSPEAILERIYEFGAVVQRDPENGWALYFIGRHLVSLGQMEEASRFFESAARFIENPADQAIVLGQYAQTQYIASGQQMTEQIRDIINQAQRLNPNEPAILQLLGADAFVNQNYQTAVTYWQRLLNLNPSAEEEQFLMQVIAQAQSMAGGEAEGSAAVADGPRVEISLSLAPEIELPPDTRVFVSAQSTEGGGPPLAAKLLTVADLPVVVTLSDADAVGPFSLSSAENIVLVATVSSSGSADVQAGDYQARSETLPLSAGESPHRMQMQIRERLE